jgi:hypothetical protein
VPDYYGFTRMPWIFEPRAGLKGVAPLRAFEVIQSMSMTSCGPTYAFNEMAPAFWQSSLSDGEVVVVFLSGPYPTQAGVLATMRLDEVVDPTLRAALESAAR